MSVAHCRNTAEDCPLHAASGMDGLHFPIIQSNPDNRHIYANGDDREYSAAMAPSSDMKGEKPPYIDNFIIG